MFGKLRKQAKKFIGKHLHTLDKGSKFLGKTIHQIEKGYRVGKSFVEQAADDIDKKLGTEGAVRQVANRAISLVEGNPIVQGASAALGETKVANKLLRKNVINNQRLNSFVGS
jgi:hypothetical protein